MPVLSHVTIVMAMCVDEPGRKYQSARIDDRLAIDGVYVAKLKDSITVETNGAADWLIPGSVVYERVCNNRARDYGRFAASGKNATQY